MRRMKYVGTDGLKGAICMKRRDTQQRNTHRENTCKGRTHAKGERKWNTTKQPFRTTARNIRGLKGAFGRGHDQM
jgi:hypothetical protein